MQPPILITVPQLAELLGAPEKAVHERIREGALPTEDGRYVAIAESVRYSRAARRDCAERRGFGEWVALDEAIEDAVKEVGADRDFIRVILASNGARYAEVVPFMREKFPEAYLAKLKRRTKKTGGPQWRTVWGETKARLKGLRKLQLGQTLFALAGIPSNPSHRPADYPRWWACFDLRNYFAYLTGKPQMPYVSRILFPDWKPASVEQAWSKWKQRFVETDGKKTVRSISKSSVTSIEQIGRGSEKPSGPEFPCWS